MHYGELKKCDIANGIGVRVTLFVSGCTNHCPDCFQPQTWDFDYGKEFTEDTKAEIFAELDKPFVNGLTVLGCEATDEMLACIDVLVDGRFMKELKDISLQFRGSRNQRVIDMNRTRETGTICIWDKLRR